VKYKLANDVKDISYAKMEKEEEETYIEYMKESLQHIWKYKI